MDNHLMYDTYCSIQYHYCLVLQPANLGVVLFSMNRTVRVLNCIIRSLVLVLLQCINRCCCLLSVCLEVTPLRPCPVQQIMK